MNSLDDPDQDEGSVSKEISSSVLTTSITSRLASAIFKMADKVVVEEAVKNIEFSRKIPIRFLRFGDNKISYVIETKYFVPLLDQTFTSAMNFSKIFLSSSKFVEQSFQPDGLSRASVQRDGDVSTQQ